MHFIILNDSPLYYVRKDCHNFSRDLEIIKPNWLKYNSTLAFFKPTMI